jgi:hypothetical protein
VIHSLTASIGHVHALFISSFERRVFSRWIVTNIRPTSARGTLHCRKTHSLRGSTRDLWALGLIMIMVLC